jgi:4-amino-4-deoxy-L-arabinose transferase-like glycosyltransferase
VALVALTFATGAMLFDAAAGLVSAACVAGCYPFVFYAHTSNVDLPLLFWIAAAIAATLWSAQRDSRLATAAVGLSAAMALLTKEQSIGALVALPVVWSVHRWGRRSLHWRDVLSHAGLAAAVFVAVTAIVANVPWNPSGYVNRWRFLLGSLPAEVREKYAPYQFMVQVPKEISLARELQKLGKAGSVLVHGLTLPVALLSLAGLLWGLRRHLSAMIVLLAVGIAYYIVSVRALELAPVRYVMPLLYIALVAAGAVVSPLAASLRRLSGMAWPALAAVALMLPLWPGVEVVRLLARDPRYEAEEWLRAVAYRSARIEVYQPPTYLPRFAVGQTVARIPVVQRTLAAFAERRPDLVVLSGGGRAGLTGSYARDWQPGKPLFADSEAAQHFFEELRAGRLGYRVVAQFRTPTWLIEPRINSLNPMITIYAPGRES